MGSRSGISWTDSTWNPSTGCSRAIVDGEISEGCRNCYVEKMAERLRRMGVRKFRDGFRFTLHSDALDLPLRWRRPRFIFVDSMSDLFHEAMPDEFLERCFKVMEEADQHTYQVLTKRPQRMLDFIRRRRHGEVPDHVWLGVSVELERYLWRLDILREVPARIRFVSFEPLLGPMGRVDLTGISWVIVGGESGPAHRPMAAGWVRELRDQSVEQGVPFFFKQWGGPRPGGEAVLDGREWREYPGR